MRAIITCETSGRVREALRRRGHEVYSVDILPSEDDSKFHIQDDALNYLNDHARYFDLMIAHPPCTYLANSGVRWLWKKDWTYDDSGNETTIDVRAPDRWVKMHEGAKFFASFLKMPIPKIAVENPIMHVYARDAISQALGCEMPKTYFVQPWWFGDKAFKATGFTLKGLQPIKKPRTALVPPKPGTPEHTAWSIIHRASPGPDRWKERSRTFPGVAEAIAENWGN